LEIEHNTKKSICQKPILTSCQKVTSFNSATNSFSLKLIITFLKNSIFFVNNINVATSTQWRGRGLVSIKGLNGITEGYFKGSVWENKVSSEFVRVLM
jgi:hypothetical protein